MERSGAFLPPDTADFKLCSKFHARGSAMAAFSLNVNGQVQNVDVLPDPPLLWVLRDAIGLTGTKFGCGVAQCGACTVFMNGKPLRSCSIPIAETGIEHDLSGLPFMKTVQAPHWATPQPNFVPVSPIASRKTQSSGGSGSTSTFCTCPFTFSEKAAIADPLA